MRMMRSEDVIEVGGEENVGWGLEGTTTTIAMKDFCMGKSYVDTSWGIYH